MRRPLLFAALVALSSTHVGASTLAASVKRPPAGAPLDFSLGDLSFAGAEPPSAGEPVPSIGPPALPNARPGASQSAPPAGNWFLHPYLRDVEGADKRPPGVNSLPFNGTDPTRSQPTLRGAILDKVIGLDITKKFD